MTKKFWHYDAPAPPPKPDDFNGTEEQWEQLSPGMRREIVRTNEKKEPNR